MKIGQRVSYTRRGMIHHGEIVSVSAVAYVVRIDEHDGRCERVLPNAILEVSTAR